MTKTADPDELCKRLPISNQRGLHARASAKFVECASSFRAHITVTREGNTVPATSIMGLMMLGAAPGTEINLCASGPQAKEALDALEKLVTDKFGEE